MKMKLVQFLAGCGVLAVAGYFSIVLAHSRTGAAVTLQSFVVLGGIVLSIGILGLLLLFRDWSLKRAAAVVVTTAALFFGVAVLHTSHSAVQTLKAQGIEVRVDREYGDAFHHFVARWRTDGSGWSERSRIGNELFERLPFRLEALGTNRYAIRDVEGKLCAHLDVATGALTRIGEDNKPAFESFPGHSR